MPLSFWRSASPPAGVKPPVNASPQAAIAKRGGQATAAAGGRQVQAALTSAPRSRSAQTPPATPSAAAQAGAPATALGARQAQAAHSATARAAVVDERKAGKAIQALRAQSTGHGPRGAGIHNALALGQALGGRHMVSSDFRWAMRQLAKPARVEVQRGVEPVEIPADPSMLLDATYYLAQSMGGKDLKDGQVTALAAALDRVGIEPFLLRRCKETLLTATGRAALPAPRKTSPPAQAQTTAIVPPPPPPGEPVSTTELTPPPPPPDELEAPPPPPDTLTAAPPPPDGPPPA